MAKGLHPEYAKEQKLMQINNLMKLYLNEDNPGKRQEIALQIKSLSPIAYNQFLAWSGNILQALTMAFGAGSALKGGKLLTGIKKGYSGIGSLKDAFQIGFQTQIASMGTGAILKQIDNVVANNPIGEKVKKSFLEMANDPFGTIVAAGMVHGLLKGGARLSGRKVEYKEKIPDSKREKIETEKLVDEITADEKPMNLEKIDIPAELVTEVNRTKEEIKNNLNVLEKEVSEIPAEVRSDKYNDLMDKITDIVTETNNWDILNEIKKLVSENKDDLKKYAGSPKEIAEAKEKLFDKYHDMTMRYILDDKQPTISKIINDIRDNVYLKGERGGNFMPGDINAGDFRENIGKKLEMHESIIKELYKQYKKDPNKNTIEFIENLDAIKNEIADNIVGKNNLRLDDIYKIFVEKSDKIITKIAKDIDERIVIKDASEYKNIKSTEDANRIMLKNLGYTDEEINKFSPETKREIIEKNIFKEGYEFAVKEKISKEVKEKGETATPGLSIFDTHKEFLDALKNAWALRLNEIEMLPKKVQKVLEKSIEKEIEKAITNKISEEEIITKIPHMINDFLKGKLDLYGFDKDTWVKIAEQIEKGTIKRGDLKEVLNILAEYKLLAQPMIKMASGDKLPHVFRVINALKKKVLDAEGDWKNIKTEIRITMAKNTLKDLIETLGSDLKKEFDSMVDKLSQSFEKEKMEYKDKYEKAIKEKYEVVWQSSPQSKEILNLADREQYENFIKTIHKLPKSSLGTAEDTLLNHLSDAVEGIRNSSETVIKKWTKTQSEVLDALGLGVINKLKNASEYHFRTKKEMHISQIKKIEKQIKIWRKSGHPLYGKMEILPSKIWEWLETEDKSKIELNVLEQRIARQLRSIFDYYAKLKKVYPDFMPIENYIRHDILEVYHNTNMLLKNNMLEGWWDGFKKAENEYLEKMRIAGGKSGSIIKKQLEISEERYNFYNNVVNNFKKRISDLIEDGKRQNKLEELVYQNAKAELQKLKSGVIGPESEFLIEALQRLDETPYWIKNRIAAGIDPRTDIINEYCLGILRDAAIDLKPYKNLEPVAIMYQILREMQGFKSFKEKAKLPAYWDREELIKWIWELNIIGADKKQTIINKLIQYDKFQKSFEIQALGELKTLDPSVIKRTTNILGYKSGDIIAQMLNYVNMSHRGLTWAPIAKIFNALEQEIRTTANKSIAVYLENLMIDIMGRETKFDSYIKGLITQGSIPIASQLLIKYYARKRGIKNPEVYRSGQLLFVKGDVWDPISQRVVQNVEGIPSYELLPKKIGNKIIDGLKVANYWATLGLSPRAGLVNLTQPLLALAKEQETVFGIIPTYKSIIQTARAYSNAISKLFNYKERQNLRRIGVLDEVNRMAIEGLLSEENASGVFGRINSAMMKIMTATEYINRVALYEYFKLKQKNNLEAAGLHSKLVNTLAKDWSDTYNFKFDALSQPQGLRTEFGKIIFHLGTFAYHQVRIVSKEFNTLFRKMPAFTRVIKTATKELSKGNWDGFIKSFDQMNNTERLGLIRWIMATYMATQAMNAMLGFSFNSVLANRTVDFYIGDGALPEMIKDVQGIIVGDNPKEKLSHLARSLIPAGLQIRRLTRWHDTGDWRYFLANSYEITGENHKQGEFYGF